MRLLNYKFKYKYKTKHEKIKKSMANYLATIKHRKQHKRSTKCYLRQWLLYTHRTNSHCKDFSRTPSHYRARLSMYN